jgi:Leucine-rich repeat (LRR) protein
MDSFTELLQLNLSFNKFISFPELGMFTMLEELDLTGNQIGSLPPIVTELVRLRELHMNGNRLTILPDEIGALTRLEKLSVANNQITTISSKIGRLRKLEEFTIMGNPLQEIPPAIGLCNGIEVRVVLASIFKLYWRSQELYWKFNGSHKEPKNFVLWRFIRSIESPIQSESSTLYSYYLFDS